jgi:hypothetical protein
VRRNRPPLRYAGFTPSLWTRRRDMRLSLYQRASRVRGA